MEREELLLKLRERIVAFAASRLQRDVAEDLAQEVLMLLEEKYPQVTQLDELLPLSFKIMRFKITGVRRKAVRHGEHTQVSVDDIQLPDSCQDPAMDMERKQILERLEQALARLGDRCKELYRLKLEGRTFPEIQKIMGIRSINTIYTWDFRCRKQLLEWMSGSWERRK